LSGKSKYTDIKVSGFIGFGEEATYCYNHVDSTSLLASTVET